ncbi:hypothetical protein BU26DRAFT_272810 [Trematosphaeria pertusa]|uniref:Hypervirulence associated protein TUDOR domain-containing protein n=1 Tax=Trematosphaeria pertusa TaxID=390896 RepID=A0A6A6IN43_9PLEO|nr:uncharacterized protein BU26DRAFT_272810 [Trematosphaeria pertusa]KAF2250893.1 hypothetical protein BU26DRAFT_272810 [Trematosphaeria pertusa]
MPKYSVGQHVRYKCVGGPHSKTPPTSGTVKQVFTAPTTLDGKHIRASADEPRYVIENVRTRKSSAVFERNILSIDEESSKQEEHGGNTGLVGEADLTGLVMGAIMGVRVEGPMGKKRIWRAMDEAEEREGEDV